MTSRAMQRSLPYFVALALLTSAVALTLAVVVAARAGAYDGVGAGDAPMAHDSALASLEQAALGGDWRAMARLGRGYARGEGVVRDPVRAHAWLSLAAAAGDAESAVLRQDLEGNMTPAELDTARRLATSLRDEMKSPASATRMPEIQLPVLGSTTPPAAGSAPGLGGAVALASLPSAPATGGSDLDRAGITDLQWQLALHGYDPGPADGSFGPRTRTAIRAYQADAGLPVDGGATRDLLDQLQYEAPGAAANDVPWETADTTDQPALDWGEAPTEAEGADLPWGQGSYAQPSAPSAPVAGGPLRAFAITVQEELAARGYRVGPADGAVGPATRSAISDYQADQGLPVDGEVSLALVNHLRFVTAN